MLMVDYCGERYGVSTTGVMKLILQKFPLYFNFTIFIKR
jgi:hypothetical protein